MHNTRALSSLVFLMVLTPYVAFATASSTCPFTWQRTLRVSAHGADVIALQHFLDVAPASGYFGKITERAVYAFQKSQNIQQVGFVGSLTRAKLNALCMNAPVTSSQVEATSTTPQTLTSTDVLTVSDPGQQASSLAPAGAGVLFLAFDLQSGARDTIINDITIERSGMGNNGAFASLGLYDENGLQIGPITTLNSNSRAVFKKPFNIPSGQKRSFEVYVSTASDLSTYDGQIPALRLIGVSASSPLSGTLPLNGNPQTLNSSLTVGAATALLSPDDPTGARTRYINDTGVHFSGIRITANAKEDITLDSIVWTQSGSASRDDLTNVITVVDGTEYPTTISPYNDHEYVTVFDPTVVIKRGNSVNVFIKGDIKTSAANRTIKFDINDINDEVSLTGSTYGFGVGLSPSGNTATEGGSVFLTSDGTTDGTTLNPFFSGSTVSVLSAGFNYIGR